VKYFTEEVCEVCWSKSQDNLLNTGKDGVELGGIDKANSSSRVWLFPVLFQKLTLLKVLESEEGIRYIPGHVSGDGRFLKWGVKNLTGKRGWKHCLWNQRMMEEILFVSLKRNFKNYLWKNMKYKSYFRHLPFIGYVSTELLFKCQMACSNFKMWFFSWQELITLTTA
jgi:hypothetical protein